MTQQAKLEGLKRDLEQTIQELDKQIDEVNFHAQQQDVPPHQMRMPDGSWALGPLLIGKAQACAALVGLYREQRDLHMQNVIYNPPYPPAGPAR